MAQTPAVSVANGDALDYTPVAAKVAGDMIAIGPRAFPIVVNLAANELGAVMTEGLFDVPKASGALNAGDAIYWDASGTPNVGDASSGAATATSASNKFVGYATADAASDAKYVRVRLADGPTTNSLPNLTPASLAAAGSAQGDAVAIGSTVGFAFITGADGTKGAVLPAAVAGKVIVVKNSDAANAILKLYPASGDAINALAANASLNMAAKTSALLVCLDATTWYTVPLLPS